MAGKEREDDFAFSGDDLFSDSEDHLSDFAGERSCSTPVSGTSVGATVLEQPPQGSGSRSSTPDTAAEIKSLLEMLIKKVEQNEASIRDLKNQVTG